MFQQSMALLLRCSLKITELLQNHLVSALDRGRPWTIITEGIQINLSAVEKRFQGKFQLMNKTRTTTERSNKTLYILRICKKSFSIYKIFVAYLK